MSFELSTLRPTMPRDYFPTRHKRQDKARQGIVTILIVIMNDHPHYSYRTELWRIEYPSRLGSRASSHKFEKSPDLDPDPSERNTVSFRVGVAGQPLRLLLLLLWQEITTKFQCCIEKRISSSSSAGSSIIRICHTSTV
mmetsp:Transcript_31323/g.31803  ORF Transcript_31323/g.31803 Transcript_31323/m.31803 type:complete len:139 (+) Transcript_31323:161-577(+)